MIYNTDMNPKGLYAAKCKEVILHYAGRIFLPKDG